MNGLDTQLFRLNYQAPSLLLVDKKTEEHIKSSAAGDFGSTRKKN